MGELDAIFERYGYNPADPARGREAPDRLLRKLASIEAPPDERLLATRALADRPPSSADLAVLELAACGLSDEEIGSRLVMSINSVKTHLKRAYVKLGARNRTHAVTIAIARCLIPTTPSDLSRSTATRNAA